MEKQTRTLFCNGVSAGPLENTKLTLNSCSFQMDVVITQKGIWFIGLAMIVMAIAVAWRIYGMVQQLIT